MTNSTSSASSSPIESFMDGVVYVSLIFSFNILNCVLYSLLIAVTAHSRNLRGSTNLLLAFDSLSVVLGQLSLALHMLPQVFFTVCWNVFAFVLQMGPFLTLCLGLDRLTVVVAPIWMLKRRQSRIALYYSAVTLLVAVFFRLTDVFLPWMFPLNAYVNYAFCFGGLFTYLAIWLLLRHREQKTTNHATVNKNAPTPNQQQARNPNNPNHNHADSSSAVDANVRFTRRIFRALFVYATIDACTWLLGSMGALNQMPQLLTVDPAFILAGNISFFLGTSLKPLALYWLSEQYHEETNKAFQQFFRCSKKKLSSFMNTFTNANVTVHPA